MSRTYTVRLRCEFNATVEKQRTMSGWNLVCAHWNRRSGSSSPSITYVRGVSLWTCADACDAMVREDMAGSSKRVSAV